MELYFLNKLLSLSITSTYKYFVDIRTFVYINAAKTKFCRPEAIKCKQGWRLHTIEYT